MKALARVAVVMLSLIVAAEGHAALKEVRETHYQMGTFLEITLWHEQPEIAKQLIREAVAEVHRLDEILSDYIPDSAVNRFNDNAGNGDSAVPGELYELLKASERFSSETAGAFDVTIGPLMKLWKQCGETGRVPGAKELASTLLLIGHDKLMLTNDGRAEFSRTGMRIDLGGIGKGYAVDRVVRQLRNHGVQSALINFGGSSWYAAGAPPGQRGWPIRLQDERGRLRGTVDLRDAALTTSGSMGRFWTIGGKRYGHVIDPRTGMAATILRIASVTTAEAITGEALSKPLILAGAAALPVIENHPGAAAIVFQNGKATASSEFRQQRRRQDQSAQ